MAKNLILWLVIAVVLMSVFQGFGGDNVAANKLDYTSFVQEVERGSVAKIMVSEDGITLNGDRRDGTKFVTILPMYDAKLIDQLIIKGVKVDRDAPEESSMLMSILISWFPMILLIGVWIFFMRQMQGGGGKGAMSFGKSKARLVGEDQINTSFADVAGCDEAKEEVAELVDYLKEPTKFQKLGGRIPTGILLVGPPGTGKTTLARIIANHCDCHFIAMSAVLGSV